MIYTIFLYQAQSGLLIYDKRFQGEDIAKTEMFSSFLTAMKSFVSELLLEGSKEIKNIELGDYTVIITGIAKINVDLVIIADNVDVKSVNKVIPKIIKLLLKYEEPFLTWDGEREVFEILDEPLTTLIFNNVKGFQKSITTSPEEVLGTIWSSGKQLSKEVRDNLIQERDMLIYKMENTPVLPKKLDIAEKVMQLSSELKDEETYIRFKKECKILKKEIEDTKFKLNYYLEKIKSTLNESIEQLGDKPIHLGDYKNTYLNLYSFSTKLKLLKGKGWEIYKELASKIIEKTSLSDHELTELIKKILEMSSNVEDYLKK
ncbi:MAG: hypothetical protein ACFE9R_18290 [Candidatus Hermodarchaeota archaeon]